MAVTAPASYYLRGLEFCKGVLIGGLLIIANLFLIGRIVEKGFGAANAVSGANGVKPLFIVAVVTKTVLLYGLIFVMIYYLKIDALGFLTGISVLFVSLFIGLAVK